MNLSDEAKSELNSLLTTSFKTLTDSIKDVKSELPKVAHEIVLYEGVISGLIGILQCLFAIVGLGAVSYGIQAYHPDFWGFHVALALLEIVAVGCLMNQFECVVKAKFAPRLFLLAYVTGMVSSTKNGSSSG